GQVLNSARLVSSSPASVTTDKTDYAPGTIVTITGKWFQPNEDVAMALHERPDAYPDFAFTTTADNQGNFTFMQFAPQAIDIGRTFTLTAIGQTSGFSAQTSFSDAPRIGAVTVGAQNGTLTFGTPGSVTFSVAIQRTQNGTVNGTMSIVGSLPVGITASFSPATWNANGNNAFPSVTLTLTSNGTTPAGNHAFTVRAADGSDISTGGTGTLTVGKATPTITWNNPADITYGTPLGASQLNATASVPGTFVYTPAAGTVLNAGNGQTLHVDFTPTDTANYNNASKNVSINVLKATPTINWNNPA